MLRKCLSSFLALCILIITLATLFPTAAFATTNDDDISLDTLLKEGGLIGDLDSDQVIGVLDLIILKNYLTNKQSLTELQLAVSDIDKNSIINIVDILMLKEKV